MRSTINSIVEIRIPGSEISLSSTLSRCVAIAAGREKGTAHTVRIDHYGPGQAKVHRPAGGGQPHRIRVNEDRILRGQCEQRYNGAIGKTLDRNKVL
jgi:hypothetical protein